MPADVKANVLRQLTRTADCPVVLRFGMYAKLPLLIQSRSVSAVFSSAGPLSELQARCAVGQVRVSDRLSRLVGMLNHCCRVAERSDRCAKPSEPLTHSL
jgi:hypothetical protein